MWELLMRLETSKTDFWFDCGGYVMCYVRFDVGAAMVVYIPDNIFRHRKDFCYITELADKSDTLPMFPFISVLRHL